MKKESAFKEYLELVRSFDNVVYFDKDHRYQIDGKFIDYSVTKLLSRWKKPFDADKFSKHIAAKEGVTQADVLALWDFKRDYANHKGTEVHKFIENILERKQTVIDRSAIVKFFNNRPDFKKKDSVDKYYYEVAKTIKNFYSFYEWYKSNFVLIKSEFVVGDIEYNTAGTMDNLSYDLETKSLAIIDYKTNKKFNTSNDYGEKLLKPLNHLENCEYVIYSLQLWLYKIMIEKNTSFKVDKIFIVWFTELEYKKFDCLNLEKEAKFILEQNVISN